VGIRTGAAVVLFCPPLECLLPDTACDMTRASCAQATLKTFQRRLYSFFLSRCRSVVFISIVFFAGNILLYNWNFSYGCVHCNLCRYSGALTDNIGGRDFSRQMCMPPVDVVYTWVNGSDMNWRRQMEQFKAAHLSLDVNQERGMMNETKGCNNLTSVLNCSSATLAVEGEVVKEEDSVGSSNRYRDNQELKYSFRSLFKYAPWVRNIYLVTSGQVPNWLNVWHPRVSVIPHSDIFSNASFLPTFSSPAIETQLHNIPGLSKKFIYCNDDVMFGAPVWPEDFFSISGSQKVYLSWDVPKCNSGCTDSWVGDGQCDINCNVSRCLWDLGDCVNVSKKNAYGYRGDTGATRSQSKSRSWAYCATGCPQTWLGDKVCDKKCDNAECAYDGGDCGIDPVWKNIPGFALQVNTTSHQFLPTVKDVVHEDFKVNDSFSLRAMQSILLKNMSEHGNISSTFSSSDPNTTLLKNDDVDISIKPTISIGTQEVYFLGEFRVPQAQKAVYFNMSFGSGARYIYKITKATHDNPDAIGGAIVLQYYNVMIVLFRNEESAKQLGWTRSTIALDVEIAASEINITGSQTEDNTDVTKISFAFDILSSAVERDENIDRTLNSSSVTGYNESSSIGVARMPNSSFPFKIPNISIPFAVSNMSFFNASSATGGGARWVYTSERGRGRRLLGGDMYADSLVKVNMLYTKKFGAQSRKVPAHMPHMIDKDVMKEFQKNYHDQVQFTSQQKFRSSEDMQFAFSYFHWLISNKPKPDVKRIFKTEIDTDQNGYLDTNEIRTLAAMVTGKSPSKDLLAKLRLNCSTLDTFLRCKEAMKSISENSRVPKLYEMKDLDEVTFEMIGDDYNKTRDQLDGIRAKRTKFICVNDDMHNPSPEVIGLLSDFYKSMFPKPSPFELPGGETNGGLDIYELRQARANDRNKMNFVYALVLVCLSTLFCRSLGRFQ
jgi:UDP-N-acetylglucosamine-lysosomal-enzyme